MRGLIGLPLGRMVAAALLVVSGVALGSGGAAAANLDEACGGPGKITCNSALFCRVPAGQCTSADVAGTCEKAPGFCMRVSRPVCGCNGKTYLNECEARHARVAVDYTGRCKKPPATDGAPAAPPAAKKKGAKPPAK
jgi:Kazal-type serine protease inhibitor-like protein